ncbi:NAD(P)-dependent oxidoreductase [Bacteroidales bacterium OttesenSCG-928-M11]|nr:NAD(P)-dependent oxidoreductase [Bacteroidales bacterium OttesenSCG-928-M11]
MKKILITGAGGFIGSFLVEEGLKADWEVWAGVRKTTNREFLQDSRIHFIDLHFSHKSSLVKQLAEHVRIYGKWDYIIHNLGVTKSLNPKNFDTINFEYVCNFVKALQDVDAIPEKFVLMSSLSADVPEKEQTYYGRSKLNAEAFLSQQQNFPSLIFRPTGVYGPREKDYLLMLKTIKTGFDVAAGCQTQYLSFIYVRDLVNLIYTALLSPINKGTYAVSDGRVYTNEEYTKLAKEAMNKKRVLKIRIPLPIVKLVSVLAEDISRITQKPSTLNRDKYRIMKRRDWSCDISPIREKFAFDPQYDLKRGLEESVAWYQENGWL